MTRNGDRREDGDARGGEDGSGEEPEEEYVVRESAPGTEDATGTDRGSRWSRFEDLPVDPVGLAIGLVIAVVAVGLLLAGPLSGLYDGGAMGPPDAEWTVQRINDTHVQVVHVGGEAVDGDALAVTVDGEPRAVDWPGTVEGGTVVVVEAPPDSVVRVLYDGDERTELAEFPVRIGPAARSVTGSSGRPPTATIPGRSHSTRQIWTSQSGRAPSVVEFGEQGVVLDGCVGRAWAGRPGPAGHSESL